MNGFVAFVLAALLLVPALLVAIPVHEMGHAAAAYFQGDRSVRYFGYFKPVTIGNFVWNDTNANGIQDGGETGVSGIAFTQDPTDWQGQRVVIDMRNKTAMAPF